MPRVLPRVCLGLVASIACANIALADLENENLLVSVPAGYKIDFQKKQGNILLSEMVPVDESVNSWTEMVTVQIFYGLKITPEQARGKLEQGWSNSCPGSQSKLIAQGAERGYPSIMWVMFCPLNSGTKKPENTWVRGIQGADSFYMVQKAYKFTPSQQQEAQWLGFLQGVSVCDSRVAERACPKMKPQ